MKKSRMKRLISLMLVLVMVLSMSSMQVFAMESQDDVVTVPDAEAGNDDVIEEPDTGGQAAVISETEAVQAVPETVPGITNRADSGVEVTDSIVKRTVFPDRPGNLGTEKKQKQFAHTMSDFQPTGLMYYPTQEFTITVSGDPADPTPSVVFSQGWYHSMMAEELTKTVKLKYGVNKVNAPNFYITGAVYISNQYSESEQKTAPTVTIESDDLQEYPIYYMSEQTRNTEYLDKDGIKGNFNDYDHFLDVLKDFKENKVDKYNGSDVWGVIYPEIADFFTDSYLITSTTSGAYANFISGKRNNGTPLESVYRKSDLDEVLAAYDASLFNMYDYEGLKKDAIDPRHSYPKNRLHMRIMDDGLCHRASKKNFFMDGGEGEELQYSLLRTKTVNSWGLLHEMAHMVENSTLKYVETTNNLYVLHRQVGLDGTNRLVNENRWNSLFSKFSSQRRLEFRNAQYGFDMSKQELTIWDRLVMIDQLNQYFIKTYPGSFTKDWDFFTAVNTAAREENLVGPQFYDGINVMTYLAAKGIPDVNGNKITIDIKPFLEICTMEDVFLTFDWYNELYEIDLPVREEKISEYAHYIDQTYAAYNGSGLAFDVRGKITKIESAGMSNKLTLTLTNGKDNVDPKTISADLLGYEVYRGKDFIGYVKAQNSDDGTTVFTDCQTNVNANYVYSVLPIDRNLKPAGKSDGYSYKNTNAFVSGKININKMEYYALTNELVVTGNGYTKRDFYRMVLNVDTVTDANGSEAETDGGTSYYAGLEKGDSYTRFFDLGFGNWEMHITNFKSKSMESFSLMPELQLCYKDDDEKEIKSTILTGDKQEYSYGAISVEGSESALLKSIKVTGLGEDENSANQGDDQQILHFDPLVKEYTYKKHSDTASDILYKPQGKITLLPVAADESASYSTEVYDTADMKNPVSSGKGLAEITFDRSVSKEYVVKVNVKSNYGEPGCKTENYEFKIKCPSEDSYLKNLKFSAEKTGTDEVKMSVDNSLITSTGPWAQEFLYLTVVGTLNDNNIKVKEFIPNQNNAEAVLEYWLVSKNGEDKVTKNEFTPTKLTGGSCELRITAADGVTVKKYHFTSEISAEEKTRAELRTTDGMFTNAKLAKPVDLKNDTKIYFSATSDPDKNTGEGYLPEIRPLVLYKTSVGSETASGKWTITGLKEGTDYQFAELGVLSFKSMKALESLKENGSASIKYTVTSIDGKHTHDYNFYYEPLDEPILTLTNMALRHEGSTTSLLYSSDVKNVDSNPPAANQVFNAKTFNYIFKTTNNNKIRFTEPTTMIGKTEVWADGVEIKKDSSYSMGPSTQEFKWIVTVPSGKKYTYNFRRFRSTDTKVTQLELNAGSLYSEDGKQISFNPEVKDYTIKVTDLSQVSFTNLTTSADATVLIFLDGVLQENLVNKVKTRAAQSATKALRAAAKAVADTDKVQNLEIQVQAANGETQSYNFQVELTGKQLDTKVLEAAINRKDTSYASNPAEDGYTAESYANLDTAYTQSKTLLQKAADQNKTPPQGSEGLILQTEVDVQAAALQKAMGDLVLTKSVVTIKETQISEANLVLEKKQTALLTARVNYSDGSFDSTGFTWASSAPDKVSVSNGKVEALEVTDSPVTITVTPDSAKYPGAAEMTCTVTVNEEPLVPIKLTQNSSSIALNGEMEITYVNTPTEGKGITYTSSDSTVVKVDGNGKVTAQKVGSATVTAAYTDAPNVSDICIFTVMAPEYTISISTTDSVTNMTVGDTAALITEVKEQGNTVIPSTAITWTSSNTAVASVDEDGKVTAKDSGTAIIYATTDYVKNPDSIEVSVAEPTYEILVGDNVPSVMYVGGTCNIEASVSMKNVQKAKETQEEKLPVIYGSSNTKVATVDSSGKVKAVGTGTVEITAAYARNTTVSASRTITVKGISLSQTGDISLLKGSDAVSFGATAESGTTIAYSSDKETVATVDSEGNITAVGPGEAVITAKVSGESADPGKSRKVYVYDLTVPTELVLAQGENSDAHSISVLPENTSLIVGTAGNNTSVVKVNPDLSLTATGGGSTEVTVKIDGTELSKKFTVKVFSMEMDVTPVTLGVSETAERAAVLKGETGDAKVSYVSSAPEVAVVDDSGKITAVKEGTAKITASIKVGEKTISKELTVKVWDIHIDKETIALGINEKNIAVAATGSEGVVLRYSTTDTQKFSVDSNTGVLTALAVGTGKVKVSVADTNVVKYVTIHVYDLNVTPESTAGKFIYLEAGKQTKLTANDGIGGVTGASYSYAVTTGTDFAAVGQDGLVTTKPGTTGNGKVQIKVSMMIDGKEKMSKTVYLGVYWLKAFTQDNNVQAGEELFLDIGLNGAYPSGAALNVKSSDETIGKLEYKYTYYLRGLKAGKVKVTASIGDLLLTKEFTVWDWQMPSESITLVPGSSYDWISVVEPSGMELKPVFSVGSGTGISIDQNGKITVAADAAAQAATVKATLNDTEKTLTVYIAPITFDADGSEAEEEIQEKLTDMVPESSPVMLTTTLVLPDGATPPVLTYESSNPQVATVTAVESNKAARAAAQTHTYYAKITPVGAGSTEITVKNGSTVLKSFNASVKSSANSAVITDVSGTNNAKDVDVKGQVIRTDSYRIEMNWGTLEYTYDFGTWNPDTHSWDKKDQKWTVQNEGDDKITLINHSSMPVDVDLEAKMYKDAQGTAEDTEITPAFEGGNQFTLQSWAEGQQTAAADVKKTVGLSFTGTPDTNKDASVRKGSAVITITGAGGTTTN